MEFFQILDCNGALGTCCTDYGLVGILSITRKIFGLIQFAVPIVLIVAGTIQFVQLSINPELKDGQRKVLNKVIAAVIIFLLPMIVDVIISTSSSNFSVLSCWQQSSVVSTETVFSGGNYYSTPDEQNSVWLDPVDFSKVSNMGAPTTASTKQQEIVEYARQFIGEEYVFGGYWNGELPYTPTDCSGFVVAIYRHFGIDLSAGAHQNMFGYHTELYDEVSESELEPGDVIMYDGHVGIYTGVGKEIIHAKGTAWGVVLDDDYSRCSSHGIMGFLRIKGVK